MKTSTKMTIKTCAMYKSFKVSRTFTTQYFGINLPLNCLYGRITQHIYIYIDDYAQFRPNMDGIKAISVNILDSRKDSGFHKYIVNNKNMLFALCYNAVAQNNLWNIKCENNLCYRKSGVRPSHFVRPQEPSQHAFGDPSRYVGLNDDMKFNELTIYAHYKGEPASMVGVGIDEETQTKYRGEYYKITGVH